MTSLLNHQSAANTHAEWVAEMTAILDLNHQEQAHLDEEIEELLQEPKAAIQTGNPDAHYIDHDLAPKILDSKRRAEDLIAHHGIRL